jgi:hypothetical protein
MIRANAQLLAVSVVGALIAALSQGCTSKASTACDPSKCAESNTCVTEMNAATNVPETKCRRVCTSQTDPTTGCPQNYTCVPDTLDTTGPATGVLYCTANTRSYPPAKGQFGAVCNPMGGLDANPDCDVANGFWCNGSSPADGNSYCTQFDCNTDSECGAGFFCGTINRFPNVQTAKPVVNNTVKVCLKRQYCAPCQTDIDCLPVNNLPQHCIGDANGSKFCASECTKDSNCNLEAFCASVPDAEPHVCYPRASVCIGDGGLCAPCRADSDCLKDGVQGACVRGEYSTESSCATPSPTPCFDAKGNATASGCPKMGEAPKAQIACFGGPSGFKDLPANYCHGVVKFSSSSVPGCYTPAR